MFAFVGPFLFIAGFVIGLGAVTVIDLLGFLGRTSGYWTEATIRAHKVTKPLIWLGISLAVVGGCITYYGEPFAGIALVHFLLVCMLIANGAYLSFVVSPTLLARERDGRATECLPVGLQRRIMVSMLISDLGWWSGLVLLVLYLV